MLALTAICWFVCLVLSGFLVVACSGEIAFTSMFPEGRRWWHWPKCAASLSAFALCVLAHPF